MKTSKKLVTLINRSLIYRRSFIDYFALILHNAVVICTIKLPWIISEEHHD